MSKPTERAADRPKHRPRPVVILMTLAVALHVASIGPVSANEPRSVLERCRTGAAENEIRSRWPHLAPDIRKDVDRVIVDAQSRPIWECWESGDAIVLILLDDRPPEVVCSEKSALVLDKRTGMSYHSPMPTMPWNAANEHLRCSSGEVQSIARGRRLIVATFATVFVEDSIERRTVLRLETFDPVTLAWSPVGHAMVATGTSVGIREIAAEDSMVDVTIYTSDCRAVVRFDLDSDEVKSTDWQLPSGDPCPTERISK